MAAACSEARVLERPSVAEYARSTNTLLRLGRAALEGSGLEAALELEVWEDWRSGVAENIGESSDLAPWLQIERVREHEYRNGHVLLADGTRMVDLVRKGYETSKAAAAQNSAMMAQAERDARDVKVAEDVNRLKPGQVYAVVSLSPTTALIKHPETYRRLGYRAGATYVQVYYRTPDGKCVTTYSFSVEGDNRHAWSDVLASYGVVVSPDTSYDHWTGHPIMRTGLPVFAAGFAAELRDRYYRRVGDRTERFSASLLVTRHEDLVRSYFEMYIRPLSIALAGGDNPHVLQDFAGALEASPAFWDFKQEMRDAITAVANEQIFPKWAASSIEQLVRFALAEALHQRLCEPASFPETLTYAAEAVLPQRLVADISAGVQAGRSYGGCSSADIGSTNGSDGETGGGRPQEAFGGRGAESSESWSWKKGVCRFKNLKYLTHDPMVGPCDICRCCQRLYDAGLDPAKIHQPVASKQPPMVRTSNLWREIARGVDSKKAAKVSQQRASLGLFALAA